MANDLRNNHEDSNITVASIFVEYFDEQDLSLEILLGSILRQVLPRSQSQDVFHEVQKMHKLAAGQLVTTDQLVDILTSILAKIERLYLVIDSMDLFPRNVQSQFRKLVTELQSSNLYLCSSSRPGPFPRETMCDCCEKNCTETFWHCDICKDGVYDMCQSCKDQGELCSGRSVTRHSIKERLHTDRFQSEDSPHQMYEPYDQYELFLRTVPSDLEYYVSWELQRESEQMSRRRKSMGPKSASTRLARKLERAPEIHHALPRAIAEKSMGCIMFAKLYVDSILFKQELGEVIDVLDRVPDNFAAYFDALLEQVKQDTESESDRLLALKILSLVASSNICDRLTLAEIGDAIELRAARPKEADPNTDSLVSLEMATKILEVTKGLVFIQDCGGRPVDPFTSLFGTYLGESCGDVFARNNVDMARLCLEYLDSNAFAKPCGDYTTLKVRQDDHPFLVYAAQHWGFYLKAAGGPKDSALWSLAKFQLNDENRIAAYIEAAWHSPSLRWEIPPGANKFHVCAWFGLESLLLDMLKHSNNNSASDFDAPEPVYGQTPLTFACRKGHLECARALLNVGANIVGEQGRMALFGAVSQGHGEIVQLLLARCSTSIINGIDSGGNGQTALMVATGYAATTGDLSILHTLLAQDGADIHKRDHEGRTALSLAVTGTSVRVVKKLLEIPEIDVNASDNDGRTVLSYAAETPSARIIGILLDTPGVEINAVDCRGRSSLHLAVEHFMYENVKLLLGKNLDPSITDKIGGRSALSIAVALDNLDMVKILLEYRVCLDWTNEDGGNLLHHACSEGCGLEMIQLLHKYGVALNRPDRNGWIPLHQACRWEGVDVVETLIELGSDLSSKTENELTPYEVAWYYDNLEVLKTLEIKAIGKGLSSLSLTCPKKVPLWVLVKRGIMDALDAAIKTGTDLDETEYSTGNTALHIAVLKSQHAILEHLLQNNIIAIDTLNHAGDTPLRTAVFGGNDDAVDLLIKYKAEVDLADQLERTALSIAHQRDNKRVAFALMEAGARLIASGVNLRPLLLLAISQDKLGVAQILINAGVDPWERDEKGYSPLQHAHVTGTEAMLKILRKERRIEQLE